MTKRMLIDATHAEEPQQFVNLIGLGLPSFQMAACGKFREREGPRPVIARGKVLDLRVSGLMQLIGCFHIAPDRSRYI